MPFWQSQIRAVGRHDVCAMSCQQCLFQQRISTGRLKIRRATNSNTNSIKHMWSSYQNRFADAPRVPLRASLCLPLSFRAFDYNQGSGAHNDHKFCSFIVNVMDLLENSECVRFFPVFSRILTTYPKFFHSTSL